MKSDNIILGDNQFFGVNHLSNNKGIKTREKFKDVSEIKKILYELKKRLVNRFHSYHTI